MVKDKELLYVNELVWVAYVYLCYTCVHFMYWMCYLFMVL